MLYPACRWAALLRLSITLSAVGLQAGESASISGTVVNDVTGAPLHMALATLVTVGAKPLEATVYTDGKGTFSFEAPPGNYYLHADESGYEGAWFGAPTPDRAPAVMALHAGEARQGIQLRLRPFSAISGVVVDQENDPVPNANVQLVSPAVVRGKHAYRVRNGAPTNGRGEFRVFHVLPGRYYLIATAQNAQMAVTRPEVAAGEPAPDLTYTPAFYPGVPRIEQATALDVRAASEVRNITLQMDARPAALVSGKVELPEGVSAAGGLTVEFQPDDGISEGAASMGFGAQPDGKFNSLRLAPGHYKARAAVNGDNEYRSVEEVDIQPGPQEITLHLIRGVRLTGHLVLQGSDAGDLTKEQVMLVPADHSMTPQMANVSAEGAFEFPSVVAGVWDIGVQPIPKGGFVKSMMLGGQDVLTEEMTVGPQTHDVLSIVISSRGGVVSGVVKQPQDDLADLAGRVRPRILLAPSGKFSEVLSFFEFTAVDESGRYELRGITPGAYRLFAFDRLEPGAWEDADFMKRIEALGKPVVVREGDRLKVDLDVASLPPGGSRK